MAVVVGAEIFTTVVIGSLVLTIAVAIHRLFFHPLAHIPGPRLAALTWWYEFYYDGIKNGRYVFKIQELHKQYGPIIRITPDELHINDIGFIDTIYAPSSSRRDKYEYQLRTLRIPGGVGTSASHDLHKKRRESLTPFFSKRNVLHLEPLVAQKVKQLQEVLAKHVELRTPVNLSDVFFAFANDIAFDFLFARKVNLLGDETEASRVRINSYSLLQGINMNKHFPWFPDLLEALPLSISKHIIPPELFDLFDLFAKVRAELEAIKAAKENETSNQDKAAARKDSVYQSLIDDPNLPPQEKTLLRLEQEGSLLVLAGSESPAASLKVLFFHLIKNPDFMSKLRADLGTVSANASWAELEKLPYLSAVIQEAHRLSWGVTARLARIAPEPLKYTPSIHVSDPTSQDKTYVIPPGTPISITTLSAHTAESVFPDPYRFDPERWLGDEGRERRKYQMAFNKGSRKCLGIELADAEMRLVTAALVRSFDMALFETDENDVHFQHDYQVAMPRLDSKGIRVMVSAA